MLIIKNNFLEIVKDLKVHYLIILKVMEMQLLMLFIDVLNVMMDFICLNMYQKTMQMFLIIMIIIFVVQEKHLLI